VAILISFNKTTDKCPQEMVAGNKFFSHGKQKRISIISGDTEENQ
jgi:hypothetical protein